MTISAADLALLQTAMGIIERVTYTETESKPDTANCVFPKRFAPRTPPHAGHF